MRIAFDVRGYDFYIICKKDCTRLLGFSSIQNCSTSMRCIAYGALLDALHGYPSMFETTCFDSIYKFAENL
jgi:hypothetical protein